MELTRKDFPFFKRNPEVAYFDNAATTLKPQGVIDAVVDYYERLSANIHRGDYAASLETSNLYERTRSKIAGFIQTDPRNIVFTSGASESLNLVANGYGKYNLHPGDVVLLSESEHASNTLPWFQLAEEIGIVVEYVPLDETGRITLDSLENALHEKVKVVSLAHISNVLGYINDIKAMAARIHHHGAVFCVDGAQSIGHIPVDVADLDVDFFAFSAHKMLGPTGVGVLYAKPEMFASMQPVNTGGGNNIRYNACGEVVFKDGPAKFESGTPNIEGVIGFGSAIDYLEKVGMENIHAMIQPLHQKALRALGAMKHVTVYNPYADSSIISFAVKGIFAQDVAVYLDSLNISVRSGEHCAKMLNGVLHAEKSVRMSLYFYNTEVEIDRFIKAMEEITIEKAIDVYL